MLASAKPPRTKTRRCLPCGIVDADDSRAHRRHDRRVIAQHQEVAFVARHEHRLSRAVEQHLVRRDEFEVESGHGDPRAQLRVQAASAASFLAFSTACSIVPTM